MGKFNAQDYETVDSRIKKFYKDHDDGRILTDLISAPNQLNTVVVRASIYVGDILKATGLAAEVRDTELKKNKAGYEYESVNYTSWVENCETSAIGRALANFNYSGDKRASREEMEKVERMQTPPDPDPDTEDPRQVILEEIGRLIKETNLPESAIRSLRNRCKGANIGALTAIKAEVTRVIETEIKDSAEGVQQEDKEQLDIF